MAVEGEDWLATAALVVEGDRVAFARLARLVTGFLTRNRAFDFRSDWDDMIQEIVLSAVRSMQAGQIESPGAFVAYVRNATRNQVIDRLRRRETRGVPQPLEEWTRNSGPPEAADEAAALDVRAAVERLPEKHRQAVLEVYAEGRTYEEAARETGIPLGSLKRYLRQGLAQLAEDLSGG